MFKLVIWDFAGRFLSQIISFGVSIVLARLLHPSEFGIVGIALALVGFSTIFYDFGFKASIIQAEEISQQQLSTIFYINVISGSLLFLICFALSSFIESFYGIKGLANVITAVGSLLIINSVTSLPLGLLARRLQFKKMTFTNFIAAAIAGTVAIIMAFTGWGVWSLITNTLINAVIIMLGSFYLAGWRPVLTFDLKSIKPLWRFGSTVFGIEVLESVFSRVDVFLIGKVFQATVLGFYTRTQSLDSMVKQFSSGSLIAVVLPYFSRIKNNVEAVRCYYKQCLHIISFIALLLTGALYLTSTDLFTFLFTKKWVFSGELFRIIALAGFVYPLSSLIVNVILALGKTRIIIPLELWKKAILLPVFVFGVLSGIKPFLYGLVVAYWVILALNAFFISKVLHLTIGKQASIIGKYILIAAVCILLISAIFNRFIFSAGVGVIVKATSFILLYSIINYIGKTFGSIIIIEKAMHFLKTRRAVKII